MEAYADRLAALGNPVRLRILKLLVEASPGGLVVQEIQEELQIPSSTLSHHLDKMKNEQLLSATREGTYLRYRVNWETLQGLLGFLTAQCCTRNLPSRASTCSESERAGL
ncbi:MAG: hypothetical protein AMXMBFR33_22130 [Candidatus Xenobia bacterium]